MKNGDTRRGPFSFRMIAVSAIVASPPIPEPMITPVRSRSASSSGIQSGIAQRLLGRGHARRG